MREQYMRTGEGFLCVYSITSRNSFDEITTFHQQILRVKDKDYFPIIMVANKSDLESERKVPSAGKPITVPLESPPAFGPMGGGSCGTTVLTRIPKLEGKELAKLFGCKFVETSAKQRTNVDEAFYNLVREIRRYTKDSTGKKKPKKCIIL
jgi:GTPase KRas protein